jgi:hypothetical protein
MSYGQYDYSWEYYPPPYDFLSPTCPPGPNPAAATAGGWTGGLVPQSHSHGKGVGSCCSSCASGGTCGSGLGQIVTPFGTLFASGFDVTQWGVGEWACVGIGAYLIASMVGDVTSGSRATKAGYRAAKRSF